MQRTPASTLAGLFSAVAVLAVAVLAASTSTVGGTRVATPEPIGRTLPATLSAESAMADINWATIEYSRAVWLFGVEAQRQEDARLAQLEYANRGGGGRSTSYHPGTTSGACSGFAIPDYIIQRESGGNPSAYNPSGAYGCAQTLLSHYSRGQCQGLDPYNIDGQRECVNRLSNGGTNLAPWAATR